jgi:hypothetical protein
VRRQQVGQAADLAPAHGVGLAGQREGAGARPADLPGRQVQVDDPGVVVGAVRRLVQSLAVQRERSGAAGEPARRLQQAGGRNAADLGGDRRRIVPDHPGQRLEAGGVRGDVAGIDQAFVDHDVEHAVEQGDVAARLDRQVEVGDLGAFRTAGIGDDDLQFRIGRPRILDAAEEDRVRHRRVGAGDEDEPGLPDVRVAARRRIGAEGLLVAGDRRRHAEPRIGIDVVGADQPFGQLVEDVVVLGHQLAGNIEGDRVRTVGADRLGKTSGRLVERLGPSSLVRGWPDDPGRRGR